MADHALAEGGATVPYEVQLDSGVAVLVHDSGAEGTEYAFVVRRKAGREATGLGPLPPR